MSATRFFYLLLIPALLMASCTQQQVSSEQSARIAVLEQRVVALERQRQKTLTDLRSETKNLIDKVDREIANFRKTQQFFIKELDTLKTDANLITNDIEKAQRDIRQNRIRIKNLVKRLGDQILALEELRNFFTSSIDEEQKISADEKTAFDKVFQQYRKRNFKAALNGFEDFRSRYPDSKLSQDALFFIGYIHFLSGRYQTATLRFFELIVQYPQSSRLNETKWWLAVSLERSGDINGALDLYRELSRLDDQNPLKVKATFRLEELATEDKKE